MPWETCFDKIDKKVKTFINSLADLTKNPFLLTRLKWLALSLCRHGQFKISWLNKSLSSANFDK